MPRYQLLVCDIAGTILKDNNEVYHAFSQVFAHHQIPVTERQIIDLMGVHKVEAMQRILEVHRPESVKSLALEMAHEFEALMLDHYRHGSGVELFHDVIPTFESLRRLGILIGLNTGFPEVITEAIMARTELKSSGIIDAYVSSDQVPAGRPSPWMIQQLMADVRVKSPSFVVKVGDTPVDILEGRNAECGLVLSVTTGSFKRTELHAHEPDGIVDSFDELLNYFA